MYRELALSLMILVGTSYGADCSLCHPKTPKGAIVGLYCRNLDKLDAVIRAIKVDRVPLVRSVASYLEWFKKREEQFWRLHDVSHQDNDDDYSRWYTLDRLLREIEREDRVRKEPFVYDRTDDRGVNIYAYYQKNAKTLSDEFDRLRDAAFEARKPGSSYEALKDVIGSLGFIEGAFSDEENGGV